MIGMHGEGYKMCVVGLARMSVFDPINISGSDALIVSVGEEDEETGLRPLDYHFFKINDQEDFHNKYNFKRIKRAFDKTMLIFSRKNEMVGELLHSYNEIEAYKSNTKDGAGFYCGLKRITIKTFLLF